MSRFSLFRWGKSKSDSEGKSRATGADRFVADDIDRKKNPGQKNSADDPQLPQKKRARRRLVGSITLVLAAIIVLPMIFESEPRPVSPNLLIDIPSKDNKPVQVAAAEQTPPSAPTAETAITPPADQAQQAQQAQVATAPTEGVAPAAQPSTPPLQQAAPVQSATEQHLTAPKEKAATTSDADIQKKQAEAQQKAEKARQEKLKAEKAKQEKARADKLKAEKTKAASGSDPIGQMIADKNTKTSTSGKQVIQVAALTSQQKVSELQAKLSKAGIHSHTQKVKARNGEERIRVRVGPLNKSDADKTCSKLKSMGLSCTLLPN